MEQNPLQGSADRVAQAGKETSREVDEIIRSAESLTTEELKAEIENTSLQAQLAGKEWLEIHSSPSSTKEGPDRTNERIARGKKQFEAAKKFWDLNVKINKLQEVLNTHS